RDRAVVSADPARSSTTGLEVPKRFAVARCRRSAPSRSVLGRKDRRQLWLDIETVLICERRDVRAERRAQLTQCDEKRRVPFLIAPVPPSHDVAKVRHRLLEE